MTIVKNATKKALGVVGLLRPAQSLWHAHLRSKSRRDFVRLYRQFLSPGDLCFDIGANVGQISQLMLALGARVVAVEPQMENVDVLRKRFMNNPNFTVVPKGAGATIGFGKLMVCGSSDCTTMSSEFVKAVIDSGRLPPDRFQWNEVREVPVTTIDELISTYGVPAFTKIDVEGLEAEVIKGCSHKLKVVSLEFTPERLHPALECIEMLCRLGQVQFNYTIGTDAELLLARWVSGNEMAAILKNAHFQIVTGPGGDLYAWFM